MPLILPGNVASATTAAYEVANSCRLNSGDSPDLKKTIGSAGNRKTWTFSCWIKRSKFGAAQNFFSGGTDGDNQNYTRIQFTAAEYIYIAHVDGGSTATEKQTTQVFRDPSAWYHIVWAVDTTQGTAANREKLYVNGVQVTSFSTNTIPAEDYETTVNEDVDMFVGNQLGTWEFFGGYMAEVCFIDGTAYAASDFGEFDDDSPTIWKPKDVSGLTFGSNGAYLDFEDSDNLGDDESGNTNDFAEDNIAAVDQCIDSPTNNFCTISPLTTISSGFTISEGNCKMANNAGTWRPSTATIGVTNGKWVMEGKCTDVGDASVYGIIDFAQYVNTQASMAEYTRAWLYRAATGYVHNNDSYEGGDSYGDAWTTNDIIGTYLDLDNNKIYWSKNGTVQNSGTGISITDGYYYTFAFNLYNSTIETNFGNPSYANSSSVSDPNGYGDFEYSTTITGDSASKAFYALCTKNLAEFG